MSDLQILRNNPRAFRAAVFMGIIATAIFTGAWYGIEFLNDPPVELLETRIVNPTVKQGEPVKLYVRITSFANRQCPGGITREWTRDAYLDDRVLPEIYRDDAPAPIVHFDRSEYLVNIPTIIDGRPLPIGVWRFQGETAYYCAWFSKGRYRTKRTTVTITAPG